ncbi:hypothetical protein [Aneurinibacillus tyrosinisolvens]|uniref:hypothetical protein n=1 Tax=Aneurinibacillus tyrosinisolvens TaxID=1443435 RepID=UPI00063F656C|nr:hypothetical protein [Aneurinibacillus tyrosinisolvens]
MVFRQDLYEQYIQELHAHLCDTMPIEQIIGSWQNSHRKRRFIAMYLLQSKEVFHFYYKKRTQLGIKGIFNQIISAMIAEPTSQLKQDIIQSIGMTKGMISGDVSSYEIKETLKDINSFALYCRKRLKQFDT